MLDKYLYAHMLITCIQVYGKLSYQYHYHTHLGARYPP